MKKTLSFMVMAFALLFAQCRKPEVKFPTPSAADEGTTVSMTVTAGPGSKTDITTAGGITWSSGDRLYVGYNNKYVGYLTLVSGSGTPTGTFSGDVTLTGITEGTEQTFHFFYLGSVDYTGSLTKGESTTVDVDFSSQNIYADANGKLANASAQHVGYGSANGTVSGGVVTGINVTLVSKVALARFSFTEAAGKGAYDGHLTLSGTNVYKDMRVNFGGTFAGKTTGGINLTRGHGERYVMLVPAGTGSKTLNFGGGATGSTILANGIEANKFYGRESAIVVPVTPFVFTVGMDGTTPRTVEFAPGNLYYDGSESKWKFESNQWDFRTYNDGTKKGGSCIGGVYNVSSGTPSGDWGLFGWSGSDTEHYGKITSTNNSADYLGEKLKDWGDITDLPPAGEGKTWRTLSKAEWSYLIGESDPGRDASLRKWSAVTFGKSGPTVKGFIIMPDGWVGTLNATTVYSTWQSLESSGAVFLPAAGYRFGTDVSNVGYNESYWSSTPAGSSSADFITFSSSLVKTSENGRSLGYSVRLVR